MKKLVQAVTASAVLAISAMALDVPANHIVDATWLKAHMGDKNLIIIDVRKKGYKKEHIKGAQHWKSSQYREGRYYSKITKKPIPGYIGAPLSVERLMKKSGIADNSAIIFYGGGTKAKDYRDPALAIMTVEYYGFDNAAMLDGGLAGWKKAGGEVTKKKPKVKKSNYKIKKFNQALLATGEDVDEAVWVGSYQTVDTNGKQEKTKNTKKGSHWYGTAKDPRRLKEGHLPGAKAMHTKVLAVEKDGVYYLGDKAHVIEEFKKAGIDPNKPVIWYCNTGHLAAGPWFATKYVLGVKDGVNKIYSGSMADYTRWPKRKLVKDDE